MQTEHCVNGGWAQEVCSQSWHFTWHGDNLHGWSTDQRDGEAVCRHAFWELPEQVNVGSMTDGPDSVRAKGCHWRKGWEVLSPQGYEG